jgi:hypothetical protein
MAWSQRSVAQSFILLTPGSRRGRNGVRLCERQGARPVRGRAAVAVAGSGRSSLVRIMTVEADYQQRLTEKCLNEPSGPPALTMTIDSPLPTSLQRHVTIANSGSETPQLRFSFKIDA